MSQSTVLFLEFVVVYLLLTWALYLPFRAGQLFNGPIYCMAIGGYTAAYCVQTLHWPLVAGLGLAVVMAAIFGFLPALGFARTRGIATAMGSIALIFIIQSVLRNLDFLGGPAGMTGLPQISYLLPMSLGLVLLIGVVLFRLEKSRAGRALEAIAVDSDFADTMGVPVKWVNVAVLTGASAIGGVAGVIYAFTIGSIQPETFGFSLLLYVWAMLFIGGRHTMWGPVVAAPLLWGFPQLLPESAAEYTNIAFGCLLVLVILAAPNGLVSRRLVRWVSGRISRSRPDDHANAAPRGIVGDGDTSGQG